MSFRALLAQHRLVVCIGTGGVGKTSLSAAIALAGAVAGRKAAVLTIDPARALGRALGIGELTGELARVDAERSSSLEFSPGGELSAGMLEPARAWDAFVERHAPAGGVARAILSNGFYKQLSRSFSGSTEYVAIEELCRLHESGRYDLIVLDTPPAAHALDFVRAPSRIDRLLDPEVLGVLVRPPPIASRILRMLRRAAGAGTLDEVSTLASSFEGLFGAVRRRSRESRALLSSDTTAFVLVAGPEPELLVGARALGASLEEIGMTLSAVVQNRVHPLVEVGNGAEAEASLARLAADGFDAECIRWLRRTHGDAVRTAHAEARDWAAFQQQLPPDLLRVRVDELDHDVHSIADLVELSARLVAP